MVIDEIISIDSIERGHSSYMGAPGSGIAGAKNNSKNL